MKRVHIYILIALLTLIGSGSAVYMVSNASKPLYYETTDEAVAEAVRQFNNDKISNERRNIITETVSKVKASVVGINVTEIRQFRDPFFSPFSNDPFFRQFFGDRSYSQEVKSLGSGFIISPDGYIITNDHVAGNATEIVVTLTNGKHYSARVVGTDPVSDICLLKVDAENLSYIPLGNSDNIIIGEWVIALGNPFGLFEVNDQPTVTVGVVSASNMNLDPVNERYYLNMIQTDAAINGGNSGGPLVNSLGEVIGVNTIIYTAGGSQGSIGLGFAIPINKVKRIISELQDRGVIDRSFYTGLSVQNIDNAIANYYNLESTKGVIITRVVKDSPAEDAGIEVGDIITRIDDYRINNDKTLIGALQEFRTGQTVKMYLLRDGKELTKNLRLDKRNDR